MAHTVCELMWIRSILIEIGFPYEPMSMYCVNQTAIYIASNPVFHEKTKHIEVDYHFIKNAMLCYAR